MLKVNYIQTLIFLTLPNDAISTSSESSITSNMIQIVIACWSSLWLEIRDLFKCLNLFFRNMRYKWDMMDLLTVIVSWNFVKSCNFIFYLDFNYLIDFSVKRKISNIYLPSFKPPENPKNLQIMPENTITRMAAFEHGWIKLFKQIYDLFM
jgi:hypothetical protein